MADNNDMGPPPSRGPKADTPMPSAMKKPNPRFAVNLTDKVGNDTTLPPPKVNKYNRKAKTGGEGKLTKSVGRLGLMQWNKLLANTDDLAQRKGAPLRRGIPVSEVKKHNKVHDAWMILRGKVYNIGPYLAYHPGGIDIMKSVLGKDGTALFDKYHRWVSIDGLVGPLLLGTAEIKTMETLDDEEEEESESDESEEEETI
ncbi:unnamed protein product [Cylindrotheca closterium]|uniref:Cytochrome b5 heme-binding domain-containing protein n=1 Tax=Cylindrotheca closterium TaxID=2856 RepID=A0AAD2FT27_9STRA|nr:unnamed protein product [Cylindrotheca closterium]